MLKEGLGNEPLVGVKGHQCCPKGADRGASWPEGLSGGRYDRLGATEQSLGIADTGRREG